MKKVKYLIIMIAMVIIPLNVSASTGNLTLNCDDQNSNEIICKVFVSGDTDIKTVDSQISIDSDAVDVEVIPVSGTEYWNSYDKEDSHLMVVKSMKIESDEEIATIILSLKEELSEDLDFKLMISAKSIGDVNDNEITNINGDSKKLTFTVSNSDNDEPNITPEPDTPQDDNNSTNPKTGILEVSAIIVLISLGLGLVIYVKKNQINY